MLISYNWLKQFLKLDWEPQRTAELLTDLGLEVEGISPYESVKGGLKGVVVGHVLTCVPHPNADRLKLTTVDIGHGVPLQIVCGAPNVAVGQKVPVATIGTVLHLSGGGSMEIKKGKIRGEESHGMICAEDELGLGQGHDGILVLSESLKPGTPCTEVFDIEVDEVFEIGLTPNRADAMSHFGVARDLRAGLKQREIVKELITPPTTHFNVDNRSLKIDVVVENNQLAPRYCGVTLSNLIVQPSPDWLQNRLRAIGITPKNNIVDATNYVLHELGQPLHAFDAARIHGKKIIVKTMPSGTRFMTLDGEERMLHEEDLMICDAEKPMCIAGVFGGIYSGVTEDTTSIFLESAYFDPVSIRKSAKRHGLHTDASFRFERGIDIENVEYSLKRAALLIKEIAGGDITSDIVDLYPVRKKEHEVFLAFDKITRLIGQEIPQDAIKSILASLEIKVKNITEAGIGLEIPSYRVDVLRPADVIEEILRVYGYNNIEFKGKWNTSIAQITRFEDHKLENMVGNLLVAQGFMEIMTNSLSSPDHGTENRDNGPVTVLNPLSGDLSVMRRSLLPSGLEAISYNLNRKRANLKLFEFGKTYHKEGESQREQRHLSLFMTGNRQEDSWTGPSQKTDFFLLKSLVEKILLRLGITDFHSLPIDGGNYSEGVFLESSTLPLVQLGTVKKSALKYFGIKQEVLHADFRWDHILELAAKEQIIFREIPKYPEVKRDLALLIDSKTTFKEIHDIAVRTEKKLLKNISLFDVYTGNNLPAGKKSYAVSFTLQDRGSTLTDSQIDKVMGKLQQRFASEIGAEIR